MKQNYIIKGLVIKCQFSSVSQSCPTLCDPMNRSTPGLLIKIPNDLIKLSFLVKVEIEVRLGIVYCNVPLYKMLQGNAFISFSIVS